MKNTSELSAILDRLTHDHDFREHLLADPVAALAGVGVTLHPDDVPAERSLPSHAAIAADKEQLVSSLESTASMWPFLLSGGVIPT